MVCSIDQLAGQSCRPYVSEVVIPLCRALGCWSALCFPTVSLLSLFSGKNLLSFLSLFLHRENISFPAGCFEIFLFPGAEQVDVSLDAIFFTCFVWSLLGFLGLLV